MQNIDMKETVSLSYFPFQIPQKLEYYIKWIQLPRLQTATLNKVYTLHGNMEGEIYLLKKPAAGAARIGILYRSPPLENVQNFRKGGGSVENYPDVFLSFLNLVKN